MTEIINIIREYYPLYIDGALTTIGVSLVTVIIGTFIGILIAMMRISKIKAIKTISAIYIEIVRGTPVLVQILICNIALHSLFKMLNVPDMYIGDFNLTRLIPGVLALVLNSAAYVAEIIRAGILSIDKGQTEAGASLGMKPNMIMRHIIMPQAIKNILPAIGNEFIVLIKESSILYVIGIPELMAKTSTIQSTTYQTLAPLIVASVIYLMITSTLSLVVGKFERRLNKDDRNKRVKKKV